MKYTLSGRQPPSTLEKADEIRMKYVDIERMLEYLEKWPDKTFIVEIPNTEGVDNDLFNWERYRDLVEDGQKIILAIKDLNIAPLCKEYKIPFFWDIPLKTFKDLVAVDELAPAYLLIDYPLTFDLQNIKKKTDTPLRCYANPRLNIPYPINNKLFETFIRPEDIPVYEPYISAADFYWETLSEERTLWHIYAEEKEWKGNLNLLFPKFNINVDNRAIPEDFGKNRLNCGQQCMSSWRCCLCINELMFAEAIRHKHYEDL